MPKKQNTRKPQSRTAARQAELQYQSRQHRKARILRIIGAVFGAIVVITLVIGVVASNLSVGQ